MFLGTFLGALGHLLDISWEPLGILFEASLGHLGRPEPHLQSYKTPKTFQENKSRMNAVLRQKIGDALKDGNTRRATSLLSSVTGIKNLD